MAKKTKKLTKKLTKNDKVVEILAKVSEIVEYAIDNQITQPAQMEELEAMLNVFVK